MKATNLKILAVALPLSLWASHAAAKSILVTGSLEAVSPKVSFPTVGNQQAFVSPFQLLAKEAANSGCRITGDPNVAMADHGEELVCLYEWTKLPPGMSAAGLAADGYLLNVGENEFKYSISYFSGSKLEKIKINEGSVVVNALEPELPDYTGITTNLSHGTITGLDVTNFNKSSGLQNVVVSVVGQEYRQVVKLESLGSCVVEVGESECTIETNGRSVGVDGRITGLTTHNLTIDAENGYFAKQNKLFPETFNLRWDYRTPDASALIMQARSPESGESQAHDVDGVSFVVENEQAKLVVSTPHFGSPGSWWVPSAKVELKPDPTFKPDIPVFEVDGVDMVDIGNMVSQPQKNFVLHPLGTPEVSNGKYIFTYDLSQVSDGRFIPSVTLNDAYDNRKEKSYDAVTLDRQPPNVQLFYKGQRFSDEGIVYFFEEMAVVALDTFDGGAEIVSAKVNGTALTMEGAAKHVKKLKGAHLGLTPQMDYPLEITVRDTAGNQYTEAMRIRYMPMDYKLKHADLEYYKEVQRLDMDVVQTKGARCALYASEEDLKKKPFGYGETQRCYLEWTSLPEGTSGSYIRGQHSLTGNLLKDSEESSNTVSYRVWMYDNKGNSALAAEESDVLEVKVPPAPTLTVTQKGVISENFFPVELTGSRFATAIAKGINADLELSADDGHEVTTLLSRQRNGYFAKSSTYQTLKVGPGKLWAKKKFDIEAKYSHASHINSTTEVETVYVPSRRIRSRIMTEDLRTLDTLNPTVTMKLGIYDSADRDFVYDKETMGEWIVYLAQERRDRETRTTHYDPITEKKKFVGGDTTFELDVSKVGYGSYRFIGVAELVSPVEGYKRRILSNSSFYRVLKGGAIDGQIKTYRIASPIPFTASVAYEPEERQDREALGDIKWEISKDGTSNWEPVPKYENKPRLRKLVDEAGHYFIRATVTNKFSGEVRTTDILEILGYEVPDLKSEGPAALYEGEKGIVKLSDHGEPASESNGIIEWSLDGDSWEEGTNQLEVTGTGERMQIWSRMSYFDNELAGEKRYDVHRHRISVKKPVPVRISLQTPRLAEAGKSFTVEPIVRLATGQLESEVVTEWVLPDGTIVQSNDLTYTPTSADAEKGRTELQFRAWVKQLKDDTYAVKDLSIRTWEYKFPKFRFDVNYRTRYAPIEATAVVRKLEHQPGRVDFTYDFQMFEGMVKERENRERLYFSATKPGIHQMRVVIKDDRGNEKTMYELLEVLPPPATKVELSANYSTQYMRQPLDASVRSRIVLGHPNDRVEKYEWFLDGKLLADQTSSRASIDNMKEGEREIKLKVTSKFGITQEETMTVQVAPNMPPKCEMTYRQYGSTISVQSGCKDSDGRMSTHNWFVDGELKKVYANNISVTGKSGEPIHFRVVGYDDSGDTAEATMEITPD
ncbi:TPA: Ig-like domain-containing protein [Vibrio parahaemolyticus]|uniref:Ig-like domain-containing protein n=1 Tax=Vibrio campbellii TaxID=680 RepID=UPI001F078A88|nr:Ig-like domain-containing protein [Vibrio campbellii]UMM06758.1 Ig-like domain-containing protein [Vibrio campbellii]